MKLPVKTLPFRIGRYPVGYNVKVHGPYNAGRYYGKADIPLGSVKIGELSGWLLRKDYSLLNVMQSPIRAYYRWAYKWYANKKFHSAGVAQWIMVYSIVSYISLYFGYLKYHRHCKYH